MVQAAALINCSCVVSYVRAKSVTIPHLTKAMVIACLITPKLDIIEFIGMLSKMSRTRDYCNELGLKCTCPSRRHRHGNANRGAFQLKDSSIARAVKMV
jgi:hypothetical protein